MGNINRMVDIVVLLILTGLSVSDIRNKKVSRRVLTLWGILTVIWKIVDFYRIRVFLEKMEQTNVENLVGICAGIGVGVLFLLVSKVTEEAIGYGDSVAIMILGGYLGFWKVVGVLFGDIGISWTSEDNAIFPIFDSWIYSDAGRAERRCIVRGYTVEMSFLTPIIMLLVMSSIYAFFYYHDKNIIAGAAYETAVVGSNKAREKPDSQTESGDRSGTDVAELETLFQSRVNGKCILLSTIQGQVMVEGDEVCVRAQGTWRKMKVSVEKRAAITEPEKKLRDIKKIKEFVNGT